MWYRGTSVQAKVSIADAKRSRHALSICWLDFANAYGSVPHWLILQCFRLYHAPDHLLSVITNIYSNLQLQVFTVKWATSMLLIREPRDFIIFLLKIDVLHTIISISFSNIHFSTIKVTCVSYYVLIHVSYMQSNELC